MNGTLVFSHGNSFPAGTYRQLLDLWTEAGLTVKAVPMFGHDHSGHAHHGQAMAAQAAPAVNLKAAWREGLDASRIERIEQQAREAGMSADEFMNPTCIPASAPR